jgi:hypothetical protein
MDKLHNFLNLEETIDQNLLNHIIKNRDIYEKQMKVKKEGELEDRFTIAEKYLRLSRSGLVQTKFRQKNKIGRFSAVGALSLQSLPKQIRHSIAGDFYYDIDIVNCHPVILEFLCKKWDFECKKLSFFINNRDTCIGYVSSDKDSVKTAFLSLLNGGTKGFNDIMKESEGGFINSFIYDFETELIEIRKSFIKMFPKRYKEFLVDKGDFNLEAKFVNTFLLEYENIILMKLYEYMGSPKNCVPCFDGIMVLKEDKFGNPLTYDTDEYIRLIKKDVGVDINLKFKSMDNPFKFITTDFGNYDDRKSFEEIKETPVNKRTQEEQSYFDNISNQRNHKIRPIITLKESEFIKVIDMDESIEWVKDITFNTGRCVGICSRMGGGKSQTNIRLVSSLLEPNTRVIVASPRVTFANAICSEYNQGLTELLGEGNFEPFVCYTDIIKKKHMRRYNRIIISMESLHYLTELYDPDYIIIDECEANLTSHISNTNGKALDENIFIFKKFLTNTDCKLVWCDAFMGVKTLDFINDLKLKTTVYNYKRKMCNRIAYILPDIDKKVESRIRKIKSPETRDIMRIKASSWWKLLCLKLDQNKKVYFPCTTRKKVELVELLFKERYPKKKGLFYVGKRKGEKAYDFSDVNALWGDCDLVMTTTTITVGINFNIKDYFNCIIMYFSSQANNLVADMIQCHYRVRHLVDNELYLFTKIINYRSKNKEDIKLSLSIKEKWYRDNYKGFEESSPKYLKNLAINIINEHEQSKCNIFEMILMYLTKCNYEIKIFRDDLENDEEEDEEDDDEDRNVDDIDIITESYLAIREIRITEKRHLENQSLLRKLTKNEEQMIRKFYFLRFFDTNIDPQSLTTSRKIYSIFWFFLSKKYKAMKMLSSCKLEKMINTGNKSLEDEAEKLFDRHSLSMLHSHDLIKIDFCKQILGEIGFEHINDTQSVVDSKCMNNLFDKYKDRFTEITDKMDIPDSRYDKNKVDFKNFLGLITRLLGNSPSSLCKFKVRTKRRKRVDGKLISNNTYGLEVGDKIIKDLIKANPDIGIELKMIPIHFYNLLGTSPFVEKDEIRKKLLK